MLTNLYIKSHEKINLKMKCRVFCCIWQRIIYLLLLHETLKSVRSGMRTHFTTLPLANGIFIYSDYERLPYIIYETTVYRVRETRFLAWQPRGVLMNKCKSFPRHTNKFWTNRTKTIFQNLRNSIRFVLIAFKYIG